MLFSTQLSVVLPFLLALSSAFPTPSGELVTDSENVQGAQSLSKRDLMQSGAPPEDFFTKLDGKKAVVVKFVDPTKTLKTRIELYNFPAEWLSKEELTSGQKGTKFAAALKEGLSKVQSPINKLAKLMDLDHVQNVNRDGNRGVEAVVKFNGFMDDFGKLKSRAALREAVAQEVNNILKPETGENVYAFKGAEPPKKKEGTESGKKKEDAKSSKQKDGE